MPTTYIDITGQKFNRLIALRNVGSSRRGNSVWEFKCDCGSIVTNEARKVKSGNTQSCGCLRPPAFENKFVDNAEHGIKHTRIYRCWAGLMSRCFNPKNESWKNYGGRGIRPCQFIQASPLNIVALIGDMPEQLTIERPNNDLGYHCGDCAECLSHGWALNIKWASREEQTRNSRQCNPVAINGITKLACDWAKDLGKSKAWMSKHYPKHRHHE